MATVDLDILNCELIGGLMGYKCHSVSFRIAEVSSKL